MSWALIILSIFCSLGLIFAITPHRMNTAVDLPIRDKFIFSHTTPDYIFIFITRHLIVFAINSTHLSVTIVPPRFSALFLMPIFCRLFSDVVIFTWVSWCLSKHGNFSYYGPLRPLFIFAFIIRPHNNYTVQIRFFLYLRPCCDLFFPHNNILFKYVGHLTHFVL